MVTIAKEPWMHFLAADTINREKVRFSCLYAVIRSVAVLPYRSSVLF
jgi:hypothetical protein